MTHPDIIQTILRNSNYHLDLFETSEIQMTYASKPKTFWNVQSEPSKLLLNRTNRLLLIGWNLLRGGQMLSVCIFNHRRMLKRVQQSAERI